MTISNVVRSAFNSNAWNSRRGLISDAELSKLNDRQLSDIGVERRQLTHDVQGEIALVQMQLGYPYGR